MSLLALCIAVFTASPVGGKPGVYCATDDLAKTPEVDYRECWSEKLGFWREVAGMTTVVTSDGQCWASDGTTLWGCSARSVRPIHLKDLSAEGACHKKEEHPAAAGALQEVVHRDEACRLVRAELRDRTGKTVSTTRIEYDPPKQALEARMAKPQGAVRQRGVREGVCITVDGERVCDESGEQATVGFDVDERGVVTEVFGHAADLQAGDRIVFIQAKPVVPSLVGEQLRGEFGEGIGVGFQRPGGEWGSRVITRWRIVAAPEGKGAAPTAPPVR